VQTWWTGVSPGVRDRWLAAAVVVAAFVPQLAVLGAQYGDLPRRDGGAVAFLLVLGQTVPLAVRSRWPAATLAVVGTCFAAHEVLAQPPTAGSLALYLALYSAGAHEERFRRPLIAVAATGLLVFVVLLALRGSPAGPLDHAVYFLVLAAFWLLGAEVRRRRSQEAEHRRLTALAAAAEERARLARELHDVVTHHVTAMVVQADAARYVAASQERVTGVLSSITSSGRTALTELRFLLGVLEATGARTPGLDSLHDLVERAGREARLVEEGDRPALPAETQLTVYRIVQESLTNAAKHAADGPAAVRIAYLADRLDVEVTSPGPAAPPGAPGSGGRGLAGLRDRVHALGGEFTAGPSAAGFRVSATIPVRSDR
jgi:signal transduction histidine kinase